MKFKLTLIFLIITLGLSAQEWDVYKNQKFGFRVLFNGETQLINKLIPVNNENIEMNMFYVDNSANPAASNIIYSVAHTAYKKEDYLKKDDERDDFVLNSAVNGATNNVNGKLLFSKDIFLNGYPGKKAKIEIQGSYIYLNLILVNHELYFAQVICTFENDENKDIYRFLKSFDLIRTNIN